MKKSILIIAIVFALCIFTTAEVRAYPYFYNYYSNTVFQNVTQAQYIANTWALSTASVTGGVNIYNVTYEYNGLYKTYYWRANITINNVWGMRKIQEEGTRTLPQLYTSPQIATLMIGEAQAMISRNIPLPVISYVNTQDPLYGMSITIGGAR